MVSCPFLLLCPNHPQVGKICFIIPCTLNPTLLLAHSKNLMLFLLKTAAAATSLCLFWCLPLFSLFCFLVPKLATKVCKCLGITFPFDCCCHQVYCTLGSKCLSMDVFSGISLSLLVPSSTTSVTGPIECCKCHFSCLILFFACGTVNEQVHCIRSMD